MHRARISRIVAIAGTAALVLSLLPGVVSAALPNAEVTNNVLVPNFERGGTTAFSSEFFFDEPSGTLSRLVATLSVTGHVVPPTPYLQGYVNGAAAGSCSTSTLVCTFRNVRAQQRVLVVLGVKAAGGGESDPPQSVTAGFVWESSGSGSGPDDQSHGDTWIDDDGATVTATESSDANYGAGFGLADNWSVGNVQTLGSGNSQAARLNRLAKGIIATVEDGSGAVFTCVSSSEFTCPTKWSGEAVEVHVAGGLPQATAFEIVITYPNGTPPPKLYVHQKDDGTLEPVYACAKKNPTLPCFTWNPQTNQATILTEENGGWRG